MSPNDAIFVTREDHYHLSNKVDQLAVKQVETSTLLSETIRRGEKTELLLYDIRKTVEEEREERRRRDQNREKYRQRREDEAEKKARNAERNLRKIVYSASFIGPALFTSLTHFIAKFFGM